MKKYQEFINEETLGNIFERMPNVYGIIANPNVTNNRNKCFGEVVIRVRLKTKKDISLKDIVEFNADKIKWRANKFDRYGRTLCLVDPYWCKLYELNIKLKVPVRILKSKVQEHDFEEKRIYFEEIDYQEMNEKQFFKRRMIEKLDEWSYRDVEAVNNLNRRILKFKDFYRALNETSRNYRIDHERLKSLRGLYNNIKQSIYKEWNQLYLKHFQNLEAENMTFEKLLNVAKEEQKSNVIPFSS